MSRLLFIATIGLCAACHHDHLDRFDQTNLVADQPGAAALTDPALINAWGIAVDGNDQAFIAANGTGEIASYSSALQVAPGFPLQTPNAAPVTGLALNSTAGLVVSGDLGIAPAEFITVSEDGKVYAFAPQATSEPTLILDLSSTNASFKGVAIVQTVGVPTVLAADFVNGTIVQLDTNLRAITPSVATTAFTDPLVPSNFGPFGIQALGALVYITYAARGQGIDEADGAGLGLVDAYTFDGNLVQRFATGAESNAPWGLALAPDDFDDFSDALIVGNFGDGTIHAYDPQNGELLGTLNDPNDNALVIDGLWGLAFGAGGDDATLFFASGPGFESHGLFGKLTARL